MTEPFRILSLDGGGIRGAATAQVLIELEKDLERSLYDSFDLIAGTSTGGLIAIYLGAKRATGEQIVDLYSAANGRRIFDKSFWDRALPVQNQPKYDGQGKRELIAQYLGDQQILSVEKKILITGYDIIQRRVAIFKSWGGSDSQYNPTLREIGDITSAAPTYFPSIESSEQPPRWLVDGGLAANNPGMCAIAEALRLGQRLEDIQMISVGTGIPTRHADRADAIGRASQNWGGIEWLQHGLIDHLFAGNSSTCEYQCATLLGANHVRIDGPLAFAKDDLDDVSAGNINNLKLHGCEWYEQKRPQIQALLPDHRRA
ncbi:hypothetical protein A9Q89_09065 [Gammaproteobacteria bacterium 53_120_T64]|nr:hypothetical protein A9Q89_09065 [Gammaproteobacteria bacterium 53_120_T64]